MISLGELKRGSVVTVTLVYDEPEDKESQNLKIYSGTWNKANFEMVYNKLAKEQLNIYEYGDDYLKGNIELEDASKVLITVPCAAGWKVYVDGKLAETSSYRDLFYVLDLEKGVHEISMEYRTPGWNLGFVVSAVSITVYIVAVIITRSVKYRRKTKQSDDN